MELKQQLEGIAAVINELRQYANQYDVENEIEDDSLVMEIHNEIISLSRHAQQLIANSYGTQNSNSM